LRLKKPRLRLPSQQLLKCQLLNLSK